MDSIEVLGITFRSASHLQHFELSMLMLLVLSVLGLGAAVQDKNGYSAFILVFGLVIHAIVAVTAINKTNWGEINGALYSIDCIWFNLLMAGVYLALYISLVIFFKRQNNRLALNR